ncbi:hypothetical protein L484_011255 [Morus notabilis]|uniref:Retrotransposon gag domain-containing protein n=1 Tax=Morus notabilis TaxID=981085 RepID=W9SAW7_9ROSA|nr:hypothetical protein L484_011255 [Morus notabilis]
MKFGKTSKVRWKASRRICRKFPSWREAWSWCWETWRSCCGRKPNQSRARPRRLRGRRRVEPSPWVRERRVVEAGGTTDRDRSRRLTGLRCRPLMEPTPMGGSSGEAKKLEATVVSLDGDALAWFQWEDGTRGIWSWGKLKSLILERFCQTPDGDLCERFLALRQVMNVREYNNNNNNNKP